MDPDLERKVAYLRAHGADQHEHSGEARLLDHLLATRALLEAWGEDPAVQDGALFHAVYGTEQFGPTTVPEERREEVRALIGARAEALAWLWCHCTRDSLEANLARPDGDDLAIVHRVTGERVALTAQQLADLGKLSVANALEQLPRCPSAYDAYARRQLAFGALASPQGIEALEAALAARA